jgi:hypothetical protein
LLSDQGSGPAFAGCDGAQDGSELEVLRLEAVTVEEVVIAAEQCQQVRGGSGCMDGQGASVGEVMGPCLIPFESQKDQGGVGLLDGDALHLRSSEGYAVLVDSLFLQVDQDVQVVVDFAVPLVMAFGLVLEVGELALKLAEAFGQLAEAFLVLHLGSFTVE